MTDRTFDIPNRDSADVGVTGMGVMGSQLARNLARHGHAVAVHNVTPDLTEALVRDHGSEGTFIPADEMADFVASLKRPRVVIVMVIAGDITDQVIDRVAEYLEPGDIVVDCGNALYTDTIRRERALRERGLLFCGAGVSGGAVGALEGPSIMPGCTDEAYDRVGPLLESIAATVDGEPCCTHISTDGSGHYVKMVHNGIEYADMQLIAEAYDLMRRGLAKEPAELAEVFRAWNETALESYLIEITAAVLAKVDEETGRPLVDVIVDEAGQKGTGRWTVQDALDLGVPVTGIAEATFARALSSSIPQRRAGAELAPLAEDFTVADPDAFVEDVRRALYAAKVVAYSQGFDQITAAAVEYDWTIDRGALARIWRDGCIIRARFLDEISAAYAADKPTVTASAGADTRAPEAETADAQGSTGGVESVPLLLAAPNLRASVEECIPALRRVVARAASAGLPVPALSASLAYYDGVRSERLPAALIQGLRDYFGSHTYARIDREGTYHTRWAQDGAEERVK
ncbi:MAG: NADP-dependent phosphogluconate dehydrogenase [Bowdeniella nasicola]|nr:NADP-dependent phosphogluconate dehydrogenase [Bowdeniella nasicola]